MQKQVFDFGLAAAQSSPVAVALPAVLLPEVDAVSALDSAAILYRLAYADTQQLRPYALARWSMPPAQLLHQRLRDALALRGPVLSGIGNTPGWVLKVELDEFSQLFDAPQSSFGLVRMRATLLLGDKLVAQRAATAKAAAPTSDAPGGVRALTAATDDVVQQTTLWAAQVMARNAMETGK